MKRSDSISYIQMNLKYLGPESIPQIVSVLQHAQERLENSPSLPSFLKAQVTFTVSAGQDRLELPPDCLRIVDNMIWTDDGVEWPVEQMSSYREQAMRTIRGERGTPCTFALENNTVHVRPIPLTDCDLHFFIFRKACPIADNESNIWTEQAGTLITALAWNIMAKARRDREAISYSQEEYFIAMNDLIGKDVYREMPTIINFGGP